MNCSFPSRRPASPLPLLALLLTLLVPGASTISAATPIYSNPVLPGDYPDPTVIRVGKEYWATATTSEWAPLFPLLRSRDLVHWEHVGNVFEHRPAWAVANFWAPELSEYRGTFYLYYTGRKQGGPLSIAVATARKPQGPWTDHGPLVSQPLGSIDAVTIVDEHDVRYLVWKEDGNSRNQPTPIWAQTLSEDGTQLLGEKKELFRNDADWERNLVEGAFILKRGEHFYCFYSGNACCGAGCNYALGVARAKSVLGPWEKHVKNPILAGNQEWRCPGHGSLVSTPEGRDYLLYHSYHAKTFIYAGRQGLLDEVTWGADGWPVINAGRGPTLQGPAPLKLAGDGLARKFEEEFRGSKLRPEWQWPVNSPPGISLRGGRLTLTPSAGQATNLLGAALGVKTTTGNYTATVLLDRSSLKPGVQAGLSAFGDAQNALGIAIVDNRVTVYQRRKNKHESVATTPAPESKTIHLRLMANEGHRFKFAYSIDGRTWQSAGKDVDLEGNYLPPWDRGIRVALTVGGSASASAEFDSFRLEP